MRKICLFILLNVSFSFYCFAQNNNYSANLINADLLKDADAVKRMDETKIVITDIGKAIIYHKYAITILNEGGDDHADFELGYDKFITVKHVEGALYDATGKKIRSMKKDELEDISLVDYDELAGDARMKKNNFQYEIYPYTIEYESEIEYNGIFDLPEWEPVEDNNFSVENSKLIVECSEDYKLRYKSFNYTNPPITTSENGIKSYIWSVENIPVIKYEEYSPVLYELTPSIFLAPTDFELQNYTGNMSSWSGFGKFIYSLNEGRDILPDNIKQVVHQLTDTLSNPYDKIKVLYQYLQNNTRYISIQLGIGGLQTLDAKYVAAKGYGDCKALSNYMHSLLKEAGIKAYYTIIKAGDYKTNCWADFPSDQFNHIILCVPLAKDTIWLECTSQTLPAGYLSGFTCNRNALLVDESGGKLVHTPNYNMNDNLQIRKITATIDSTGFLQFTSNTKYTGLQQDYLDGMLNALSKEKVMEYLKQEDIDLPSYDVTKFDYKEDKNFLPAVYENLEIVSNNYASVSGKRIFINPDILNRSHTKLEDVDQRKFDIVLHEGFKDIDSVEISIPTGYTAESIPKDINLQTKFGKYSCSIKILPDKIIYYRTNERIGGTYPATDATALADYFKAIRKADRSKIVLVKNN